MFPIDKQMLFLLTRVPVITVQRFLEIYTARGYSQQTVRNVLSRLKQLGYIDTVERSQYTITEHGRSTLYAIANKGIHYGTQWDGQWQLVTFEIPDAQRAKKYQLRTSLLNLGFAALYKNTYISPWNYINEVNRLVCELELQSNVTQMKGEFHHFSINYDIALAMWKLEDVKESYNIKWQYFMDELVPAIEKHKKAGDALQLFIRYLELGELMGELVIIDPMLPAELLPANWRGQQILDTLYSLFSSLYHEIPKDAYYYHLMKSE